MLTAGEQQKNKKNGLEKSHELGIDKVCAGPECRGSGRSALPRTGQGRRAGWELHGRARLWAAAVRGGTCSRCGARASSPIGARFVVLYRKYVTCVLRVCVRAAAPESPVPACCGRRPTSATTAPLAALAGGRPHARRPHRWLGRLAQSRRPRRPVPLRPRTTSRRHRKPSLARRRPHRRPPRRPRRLGRLCRRT